MSTIGLGTSYDHSTPIVEEFGIKLDDVNEMDEDEIDLENAEVSIPQNIATNNNSESSSKHIASHMGLVSIILLFVQIILFLSEIGLAEERIEK
ncbi:hypothetical protein V6N13_036707 [Hibiscus sabdariffa]